MVKRLLKGSLSAWENPIISEGKIAMTEFKKVAVLENENEARLLESILIERAVPHVLRSYHDTAFDGLYQTQKGWGQVNAPAHYHGEINEIISDLRGTAKMKNDS